MPYRRLYLWVEGTDDQRFVDSVLRPRLEQHYSWVNVLPYAGWRKEKITKFIESIRGMRDSDYVFIADNDKHPCVSAKKEAVCQRIKSVEPHRIAIAVTEIESWYLAGLNADGCVKLEIAIPTDTTGLTKEQFDQLRRPSYESRIDWMVEMLRHYSLDQAVTRNTSLRYFVAKYVPTLGNV
jgi:hypothetical protein